MRLYRYPATSVQLPCREMVQNKKASEYDQEILQSRAKAACIDRAIFSTVPS